MQRMAKNGLRTRLKSILKWYFKGIMTKHYLSTEQKAASLGMTKNGLEAAIKKGRIVPAVIVGVKTKGFEPEQVLAPKGKAGRKAKL